jgi:hypothetical protein
MAVRQLSIGRRHPRRRTQKATFEPASSFCAEFAIHQRFKFVPQRVVVMMVVVAVPITIIITIIVERFLFLWRSSSSDGSSGVQRSVFAIYRLSELPYSVADVFLYDKRNARMPEGEGGYCSSSSSWVVVITVTTSS